MTHLNPSSIVARTQPWEWPYSPNASIIVRSWNGGPDRPLDDAVDEDEDLQSCGSMAMSSKEVERISSRNILAR